MHRLLPIAALSLVALLSVACGGAPEPDPAPQPDPEPEVAEAPEAPRLADDGAKPGEHGCGSCAVRVCAAGTDISGLRVRIKLETALKDVRYQKAVLRLKAADGRSEATLLDPAKLAAGVGATQSISATKFSELKSSTDLKGATGELELRWSSPQGPGGQVFTLPVAVGGCP